MKRSIALAVVMALTLALPVTAATLPAKAMHKGDTIRLTCPTTLAATWNAAHTAVTIKCAKAVMPAPTPTPIARVPVTVSGTDPEGTDYFRTASFKLAPGAYNIAITGTATDSDNVIVRVVNAAGSERSLFNAINWDANHDPVSPYSFTTYDSGYAGGIYYLVLTVPTGAWSVTFTPA